MDSRGTNYVWRSCATILATVCLTTGVLTAGTARAADDHISIQFCDDGPGFEEDSIDKLFDPFFTTKANGTGLGLSIVHQIVTSHRGKLSARNNPDKQGAIVEILLPIIQESDTK